MKVVGPIEFTEEEKAFARQINEAFPAETRADLFRSLKLPPELEGEPLFGDNYPAFDEGDIETGSTDVGDVSWITPLSMLSTTCFASGAPGHSWGVVATGRTSIAHKGMLHAAKIMALTAMDLYTDPEHLRKAREEFAAATRDHPYKNPLPAHAHLPLE